MVLQRNNYSVIIAKSISSKTLMQYLFHFRFLAYIMSFSASHL